MILSSLDLVDFFVPNRGGCMVLGWAGWIFRAEDGLFVTCASVCLVGSSLCTLRVEMRLGDHAAGG